jgi:hypothetical protein
MEKDIENDPKGKYILRTVSLGPKDGRRNASLQCLAENSPSNLRIPPYFYIADYALHFSY